MRILGFDTATSATAVALMEIASPDRGAGAHTPAQPALQLEDRDDPPAGARPRHTQRLLELSAGLLAREGGFRSLDRIAVGTGPGTFTGLRIGIASAHALARSLSIPLVGVCTLRALALPARELHDAPLLVLIDARRGELFAAAWAAGTDPRHDDPLIAPRVLRPDRLSAALAEIGAGVVAVGDGAVKCSAALLQMGADVPADPSSLHRVQARAHCILGAALEPGPPDAVRPAYLREPDAELARRGMEAG